MREILFMWIAAMFGAAVGFVVGRGRRRSADEWPEDRVLGAGSEPTAVEGVPEIVEWHARWNSEYIGRVEKMPDGRLLYTNVPLRGDTE